MIDPDGFRFTYYSYGNASRTKTLINLTNATTTFAFDAANRAESSCRILHPV